MADKLEFAPMWGGADYIADRLPKIEPIMLTDIQFVAKMQEELCEYKEFITYLYLCACKKEFVSRIKFDNEDLNTASLLLERWIKKINDKKE